MNYTYCLHGNVRLGSLDTAYNVTNINDKYLRENMPHT